MSSDTQVSPTYQTIESTPIQIVAVDGVRCCGWIRANRRGAAPW